MISLCYSTAGRFSVFIPKDFRTFRENFSVFEHRGKTDDIRDRRNGQIACPVSDAADDHNDIIVGKCLRDSLRNGRPLGFHLLSLNIGKAEQVKFLLNQSAEVFLMHVSEKKNFRLHEITPFIFILSFKYVNFPHKV